MTHLWPGRAAGFLLTLLVILSDRVLKLWALTAPELNALECFDSGVMCGFIEFEFMPDISFVWSNELNLGLPHSRWIVVALSSIAILFFLLGLWHAQRWLTVFSTALLVGGGIGNLIDRVQFGAIPNMIDFRDIGIVLIMNIASYSLALGAILLTIDQYFIAGSARRSPRLRALLSAPDRFEAPNKPST